ncbi:hypothetical protein KFE25_012752 [Diacronema lutheri]|uniref:BCNT-C domain-containing protein n=1 Tax=Diacronema lutheri TaxID=2081491 RepID=A0A8J6C0Q6_DIALT|nr:hypothetical protein KFE25_012752 [Diacronema lutheri]
MAKDVLADYDSEEDDDYVPDGNESSDGEREGGSRRKGAKGKASAARNQAGGPRRLGGIVLEGEEGDEDGVQMAGSVGASDAPAAPGASGAARAANPEGKAKASGAVDDLWAELNAPRAGAPSKRAAPVDDLWAQMNAAPPAKKAASPATAGTGASGGASGAAAAAAAAVRYAVPGVAAGKRKGFVSVSEAKDFVGERHVVCRELRVGSREELALRAVGAAGFALGTPLPDAPAPDDAGAARPSAVEALGSAAALLGAAPAPAPSSKGSALRAAQALAAVRALTGAGAKPPPTVSGALAAAGGGGGAGSGAGGGGGGGGGMSALLARIDKPKKMSTMEKSALDWGKFKQGQDAAELAAMEAFAQDGYLERQAFMQRMDARQAANARDVRRKRMGIND